MKEKEFRLKIISELVELHNKVGYKSEEFDEEIIQTISDPQSSKKDLKEKRNEMWIIYIRLLLDNIYSLLSDLSKNFVNIDKIKPFDVKFKELQDKYEEIDLSTEFNKIKKLFSDSFELYRSIRKEEKTLKKVGLRDLD